MPLPFLLAFAVVSFHKMLMRILLLFLALVTAVSAQDQRRRRTLPNEPQLSMPPSSNAPVIPSIPSLTAPILPIVQQGKTAVSMRARFGKEGVIISKGLNWRVFLAAPNEDNSFTLVSESNEPAPIFALDQGQYIVHVGFGLATSVRKLDVAAEGQRELFQINAGAMILKAIVGEKRLPNENLSFDLYQGSQFDGKEPQLLMKGARADRLIILPEGTYHVVSLFGDANATVRADTKVVTGKVTDAVMQHRAGEANIKILTTEKAPSWTILNSSGDVIKEATSDGAVVALLEGEYLAMARVEGRVFSQKFQVEAGFSVNVEVNAK